MDDLVVFVDKPILFRLDGALVRIEIESSGTTVHLALPVNTFLASFRNAAETAHQWRGGKVEVVEIHAASS